MNPLSRFYRRVRHRIPHVSMIVDRSRALGNFAPLDVGYEVGLRKEAVAREHLFARPGRELTFLDVGARDGRLDYLLGIHENLRFDPEFYEANLRAFREKYRYFGLDLAPSDDPNVIVGDICSERFGDAHDEFEAFFDVVYSNNVFEHLRRPWVAAKNIVQMLKPGGICITITPFSLRYHESPADYFRYSHTGLASLFEDAGQVEVLVSGYDLVGRRNNWQGLGEANDIVPVDRFGAWRENWFTLCIVQKGA
jgi:SAM-dependent methyltransferase